MAAHSSGRICGDKLKCFSEIGESCTALKSALSLHLCGKLGRRGFESVILLVSFTLTVFSLPLSAVYLICSCCMADGLRSVLEGLLLVVCSLF